MPLITYFCGDLRRHLSNYQLTCVMRLKLERAPVGIKHEFFKPEGVDKLRKSVDGRLLPLFMRKNGDLARDGGSERQG